MKILVLGKRTGETCYISLHMKVRVGDLAGLHMCMGEWRAQNPDKKLIVFYNPFDRVHEYSRQVPIDWVFENIADELWIKEERDVGFSLPGRQVYDFFYQDSKVHLHLWAHWNRLRKARHFNPKIKLRDDVLATADKYLSENKVPVCSPGFVAIQALFDAGYHKYRNAPLPWWIKLCDTVAKKGLPVVLLGPTRWMGNPTVPNGVIPAFKTVSSPYEAMAIGSRAKVFVGGETGLPLWEPLFGVPVVAAFRHWRLDQGKYDYRPMSFGAPVVFAPLEGDCESVANVIAGVFSGTIKESTPAC
jgi:hypothetical protein